MLSNPLVESSFSLKKPESCALVIFGATGDLTARKLVPALYNLAREGQLPSHFACVGFARREKTHEMFREEMEHAVAAFSRIKPIDPAIWSDFSQDLYYHRSEFHEDEGYESLGRFLKQLDLQKDTKGNRVFYLSTQPSFFPLIIEKLKEHHLLYDDPSSGKWSRIIIEKPFGHDLASALQLQEHIEKHMKESQVYRIDHYLGKETVQNLLSFRFSNPIFENLWNHHHIDHFQITVAEDIGIGTRGKFWEEAGILRDIVQNHVMQLLSLIAMEPPSSLDSGSIHDEKVKVLHAIRPLEAHDVVRGQYGKGIVQGKAVVGYREENNVLPGSSQSTYVALKLLIDNWRWTGVPFYIRAGKHLPKRTTEIAVCFKKAPGILFPQAESNVLAIRIQPDEGISLKMNCKVPALQTTLQPVKMDFRYGLYFGLTPPEAYERLICDCMAGDSTLFARNDEVLASWKLLSPILHRWEETTPSFPNYAAGTWGPEEADQLLTKEGRQWRLL